MSRGSSILAGLILVGTLSALAVVLEGSGAAVRVARNAESQVATSHAAKKGTVKVVTPMPPKTKDAAKEDVRQCEPNFNYKVLVDPRTKDTKVICVVPTTTKESDYRCPGDLKGCSNDKDADVTAHNAKSDYTKCSTFPCDGWTKQQWESHCATDSQLKLCAPQDIEKAAKSKEDDKSCIFSQCNLKDADKGVVAKAKQGAAKNLPSLLKGLDSTKDKDTLEALKSTQGVLKADKSTADILSKAFDDAGKAVDTDLAKVDESIAESRRRLKQLGNDPGCMGGKCKDDEQAEQRRLENLENQRRQLLAQKQRLASAAKELESKEGPPGKGMPPPGNQGPGNERVPGNERGPFNGNNGNTFPKLPMMPMMGQGGKGQGQGQGQGQYPQQCYNYQQYSAQNNAYCANGSIYAYNSQTCQYQVQLQCPSGQCNTQNLTNDMYGRQISTQCAPTTPTNTQITAQLTCTPRRIDLGSSVALTYSCSQGTATGNGFTASGQNGSASVTPEKPPRGSTSVTYGLTCTGSQGQTVQATPCQVEVGVPTIVIVASPQIVESGKYTTLGWVTRGIKSCVIQSTDDRHRDWNEAQKGRTNPSGTAKSPDLTADTVFELTCKTQEDKEKKSNVTVRIKS